MNQKQMLGILAVLFLLGGFMIFNQTPTNKKNTILVGIYSEFEKCESDATQVHNELRYALHGNPNTRDPPPPPNRENLVALLNSTEEIREREYKLNKEFKTSMGTNDNLPEVIDLIRRTEGLIGNIKIAISQMPPRTVADYKAPQMPQHHQAQAPSSVVINANTFHGASYSVTEAQRGNVSNYTDASKMTMSSQDQILQEAMRTTYANKSQTHLGGDTFQNTQEGDKILINEGSSHTAINNTGRGATSVNVDEIKAKMASIKENPGNKYDKPKPPEPDTVNDGTLSSAATAFKPEIESSGTLDRDRRTNPSMALDEHAIPTVAEDPKVDAPKVPALVRSPPLSHEGIARPTESNKEPPVEKPHAQTNEIPVQLRNEVMKTTVDTKKSMTRPGTIDRPESAKKPRFTKEKEVPEKLGNIRTMTGVEKPPEAPDSVADPPMFVPEVSSMRTSRPRTQDSAPRETLDAPLMPYSDPPSASSRRKKGRLDNYNKSMNSKADQLITIIKDIEEQGEFPQNEKVKEFWSKYRDLKYTVPTSIEIRPNLLAKIPGNVITMKTPSSRTFVKVYDEKDMDLTKQVKVGDKLIKTLNEYLSAQKTSALAVRTRSPGYAIWKKSIEMVEHHRNDVSAIKVKQPRII